MIALTAASNVAALADAALRTGARLAVIDDPALLPELEQRLAGSGCRAATGREALAEAAAGEAEWVMAAIVGCAGLEPVMAAIEAGRTVALANKESLVTAGELMIDAARRIGRDDPCRSTASIMRFSNALPAIAPAMSQDWY